MALQLWRSLHKLSKPVFTSYVNNRQFFIASSLLNDTNIDNIEKSDVTEDKRQKQGLTIDNPILVASHTDKIIVGCNCNEEDPTLKWFFLEEGPAQVCNCGFYFKLDLIEKKDWIPKYSQVMQVDKNMPDPRAGRPGMPFLRSKKKEND